MQPSENRLSVSDESRFSRQREKHRLGGVFGGVVISQDRFTRSEDRARMPPDDQLKALLSPLDR